MEEYVSLQTVLDIVSQYCPDDDGSCSKADVDLREMLDEIEALPTVDVQPVDRWISVDERLPNTDERVLVYIPRPDNHYNIEIAYISEGNDDYPYWVLRDKSQFYSTRFYYISHWQSLPELPKDGEKYA